MSVVALGGGHGLYTSLSALRGVVGPLAAVVTVADDGGSSGRLREEMGIVPPGDLRMALSALCDEGEWGTRWRDVLQSRFATPGPLNGHAVGNLLIAALWEQTGDLIDGLDWVGTLLKARGRVLPLAAEPLEITAVVDDGSGPRTVRGQAEVATAVGTVTALSISPALPKVPRQTIDAISSADAVVLGPGSWFTSVLVHFLVEPVAQALVEAGPRTVLALNIAFEDKETAGSDRVDDIRALRAIAPEFRPRVVVVDASHDDPPLRAELRDWGVDCIVADVKDPQHVARHDVQRFAQALDEALSRLSHPESVAG